MLYLLILGILFGIGLGFAQGGRLGVLGQMPLRFGWVFVFAVVVQYIAVVHLARRLDVPLSIAQIVLIASYAATLGGVWINRKLPGMAVIGIGILLNTLAALPQGGFMATTAETLEAAGRPVPPVVATDGARPNLISKDIVLPQDEILFWPIADRLILPAGLPVSGVFSPGDVAITGGVIWMFAGGMTASRRSERGALSLEGGPKTARRGEAG